MSNTGSVRTTYNMYVRFIDTLKNIFSNRDNVTQEHIHSCADSISDILDEQVDKKLDNKIKSSDIATKYDILILDHKIELLDHKVDSIKTEVDKKINGMTILIIVSIGGLIAISNWLVPYVSK